MRILITSSASPMGRAVAAELEGDHQLRLFDEDPAQGSAADRLKLSAIYAPWLLVPLILTARMLRPEPFRLQAAGGKPGKKRKAG